MWYNYFVQWVFRKKFQAYVFPFESSDAKIAKMSDAEKKEYYRQAKDLLENRVFQQELQESIRKFYQELALKTGSVADMQAHRLTCTFIQDFHRRVMSLATLYQPPSINEIAKRL